MHPLLNHQLQHFMGADFVLPEGEMIHLFEAISGHYRELEYLARFDSLTGVANRRHFSEKVQAEMASSVRYGNPFSILMMDIDNFKKVNDVYGHQAGDIVLQTLCEICKIILCEIDVVGRWGGEEFAVLLPDTSPAIAPQVAERLRCAIERECVLLGNDQLYFSVSIGCASCNGLDDNVKDILGLADRALYDAKRTGRNRVCVAVQ